MCKMTNNTDYLESHLTFHPHPSHETIALQMLANSTDSGSEKKVFRPF